MSFLIADRIKLLDKLLYYLYLVLTNFIILMLKIKVLETLESCTYNYLAIEFIKSFMLLLLRIVEI